MLVERGAVEARERKVVGRENAPAPSRGSPRCRGDGGNRRETEIVGRAEARGRREVARHLVAPRAAERMLHHGHQLDVGETQFARRNRRARRQLAIGEPAVALLRDAPPRSEMDFVDRNWRVQRVARRARRPSNRRPRSGNGIDKLSTRSPAAAPAPPPTDRSSDTAALRADEFHTCSAHRLELRDEQLPDSRAAHRPHHVDAAVPRVKVAYHAEAARIRRPDRERHAGDPAQLARMRTEHFVGTLVFEFTEQVKVEIADRWQEAVRIVNRG